MDALLKTAEALLVPVEQSVKIVITCLVMRKLHFDSWGCDHRGNTAFTMVACSRIKIINTMLLHLFNSHLRKVKIVQTDYYLGCMWALMQF